MKNYSQNREQHYILDYLGEEGVFLDIGAFHPETFSNTRALFERGWSGVCIEPSLYCYPSLRDFYQGTNVEVYNCAIGRETEVIELWDSNGDALSSTDLEHVKKWTESHGSKFTKVHVQCYTLEDLLEQSAHTHFNFVSIDVENDRLGIDILKQVNLTSVGMICLECNDDLRNEVKTYMSGWNQIYTNSENILLAR